MAFYNRILSVVEKNAPSGFVRVFAAKHSKNSNKTKNIVSLLIKASHYEKTADRNTNI